ncbi:MAG TPA: amidase [Gemmatimonadales bacterium]|nr:amidase [Gemmatimonadales bacterium]
MLRDSEYLRYDGLGLAELVRRREVAPRELVEAALARIDALNPSLNAVIHRNDAAALASAERSSGEGPFGGVPFLVKDLVSLVAGEPYRAGSRFFEGFVPEQDSELVRRYRAAGLVLLGKTNTPEFGLTPTTEPELFGPTRNPWSLSRTAGGSSGGSAAAVAAGLVPVAGGGDGGGSIRIPASCCGLFGMKPTRGRVPTGPAYGEIWHGAVVEHVLTRSVRDSAAVLDATHGPDPGAPYAAPPPERPWLEEVSRDPGRLRIAFTDRPFLEGEVHPEVKAALGETARLLEGLGHHVEEAAPRVDPHGFAKAFLTMICGELLADIQEGEARFARRARRRDFEPATWALALLGRAISAAEFTRAVRYLERAAREIGAFTEQWDVLLTPTVSAPPVPLGSLLPTPGERRLLEITGVLRSPGILRMAGLLDQMAAKVYAFIPWTPVANVTGQPAMSLPLAWSRDGLPMGMHFVGRFADEATLYRLAGQLERARPWTDRRPPLAGSTAS